LADRSSAIAQGSVFIQVIQGQVTNPDGIHAELDR
jgi:hypothetical protein